VLTCERDVLVLVLFVCVHAYPNNAVRRQSRRSYSQKSTLDCETQVTTSACTATKDGT